MEDTTDPAYAARLARLQGARWKRYVPNPYRWYLRRLGLGQVLEVGCGIGRLLGYLDGNGVGIDHNQAAVDHCRSLGFDARTPEQFLAEATRGSFDSMVVAHVLEHLDAAEADTLMDTYLPYVRTGGTVVLVTPQQRGQRSDPTHRRMLDLEALEALATHHHLTVERARSFPFPRMAGRWFVHNESILVARVPSTRPRLNAAPNGS